MTLDAFLQSISSSALRAVARHWQDARGERLMPAWESLRPAAIAGQLSMIWVFKYDSLTGEFTGRLAGERIARGFDRNFRGLPLKELHPGEFFPSVHASMLALVQQPTLAHYKGRLFRQRDRFGLGERLILPLSTDGVQCDGLLGTSEYAFPVQDHSYGPVELLTEGARHFFLRSDRAAA